LGLAVSFGGVAWRSRLAVAVGGPGYSHQLGPPPELGLAVSAGGVCWRCRLAVSASWRTGLQPGRFRLNSFPAHRLQATPTDVFRIAIPAQVLGGLAWRSQLAESVGGVSWRCRLAVSAGCVGWRTTPVGATPQIGACRNAPVTSWGHPPNWGWRCLLAVSVGGVSWRTGLKPGRFRLNSFPASRLQARPTDVFRIAIPAQVLGGLAWRSQLADHPSWGHPPDWGWRCRLAESLGGVAWRWQLADRVTVTSWGHPPNWGWRCRLAVSVGGVCWRCLLADRVTAMAIPP